MPAEFIVYRALMLVLSATNAAVPLLAQFVLLAGLEHYAQCVRLDMQLKHAQSATRDTSQTLVCATAALP